MATKRVIINVVLQVPFAELILTKLAPNGVFHMATDWEPYAEYA